MVNDLQTFGAMAEGVELISSVITRYSIVEMLYLHEDSPAKDQLADSIVMVYAAILRFLSNARRYYSRRTGARLARSVLQSADMTVDTYLQKISEAESTVEKYANLVDATYSRRLAMILDNLSSKIEGMNSQIDIIHSGIGRLQMNWIAQFSTTEAERKTLLKWLSAVYTDEDFEAAISARTDGTCEWLLQRSQFQDWITMGTNTTKILWIHGPPGCGKTTLCGRLIQYFRHQSSVPLAFFFCVWENEAKRQPLAIVRSWIAQIVSQSNDALEAAKELHCGKETRAATQSDIWELFKMIILKVRNCVFVVDGFDECVQIDTASRIPTSDGWTTFFERLVTITSESETRILFVSRNDAGIRCHLGSSRPDASISSLFFEYEITPQDTSDDIKSYAKTMVNKKLSNKSNKVREEIAERAADKCEGMFLWVRLLQPRLSPGKNYRQLQEIVSSTPTGFDHAYQRELERIYALGREERDRTIAILRWTLFATRPLTVQELVEALLINMSDLDASFPKEDLPDTYDKPSVDDLILAPCGSLIILRGYETELATKTVHFVHFSLREYLSKSYDLNSPSLERFFFPNTASEHEYLARACLQYLCSNDFGGHQTTATSFEKITNQHKFITYAALSWIQHASLCMDFTKGIIRLTNRLFDPRGSRWVVWSQIFETDRESFEAFTQYRKDSMPTPLYYASLLGLTKTIDFLINQGIDVNARWGKYGYALQAAAVNGHEQAVEFLIEKGANVNLIGGEFGTAIAAAASNISLKDSTNIVQLLVERGADVTSHGKDGRTPLFWAARVGAIKATEILLRHDANINAASTNGETPLFCASLNGHEALVEVLLSHGAKANAADNNGWTVLHSAAQNGHEGVIKILLDHGADVKAANNNGWTAMHLAAENGHEAVVKILLDHGAEAKAAANRWTALHLAAENGHEGVIKTLLNHGAGVQSADNNGWTALHLAAQNGYETVVKILLNHGVDAKAAKNNGWTVLHSAAREGHEVVAKVLLDHNAEAKAADNNGWTVLQSAARNGHEGVVKILLDHGADAKAANNNGWTAMHLAAENGHDAVVKTLLDHGAEAKAAANRWTALHLAAENGHEAVVKILLDHDAEVKAANNNRCTALHLAAANGHEAVIKILLDHGAEAKAVDNGWTALHLAAENGHEAVVKILLDHGAEAKAANNNGWTVLHLAARNGHKAVVKILLDHGVEVNAVGNDGWTGLHSAAHNGHETVVKVLLDHGAKADAQCRMGQTPLHTAISHGRLEIVQLLLSLSANPSILDGYGRTCIDYASLYPQTLNVLSTYHSELHHTDSTETTKILWKSIATLANRLRHSQSEISFAQLGKCLLLLGESQDACTAFEQPIIRKSDKTGPVHLATCDFCDQGLISGDRFVCSKCMDIDLCSVCMERYDKGESVQGCEGHDFLRVPGEGWRQLREQEVNRCGETRDEWLERLAKKYDVDNKESFEHESETMQERK